MFGMVLKNTVFILQSKKDAGGMEGVQDIEKFNIADFQRQYDQSQHGLWQ